MYFTSFSYHFRIFTLILVTILWKSLSNHKYLQTYFTYLFLTLERNLKSSKIRENNQCLVVGNSSPIGVGLRQAAILFLLPLSAPFQKDFKNCGVRICTFYRKGFSHISVSALFSNTRMFCLFKLHSRF